MINLIGIYVKNPRIISSGEKLPTTKAPFKHDLHSIKIDLLITNPYHEEVSMHFTSAPSVRQYEPKKRKYKITEAPTYSDDDEMVQSYLVAENEDYVQDLDFLADFVPHLP